MLSGRGVAIGFMLAASLPASACLTSTAVTCDDGRVCADGLVCVARGCAAPDDVAACDGRGEGEVCTRDGQPPERCRGGVCVIAICGDGVVDPDEVCDDGDTLSADGCSADCQSDEACGNGVIDGAVGEFCDDGDPRSGDGCASTCVLEVDAWRELPPVTLPARYLSALAYDPGLGGVLLVGGRSASGSPLADSWLLRDGVWSPVPGAAPGAAYGAAMAYDLAASRMVRWGGGDLAAESNQTWVRDALGWSLLPTAHSPAPSSGAIMTFDRGRARLVLYVPRGSWAEPEVASETWEFVDGDWVEVADAGAPRLYAATMAYHPGRARVILVSGSDGLTWFGDSYEYDGTTWQPLDVGGGGGPVPVSPVSPRAGAAMAYDEVAGHMVLVGGTDPFSPFDGGQDDAYVLGAAGGWETPLELPVPDGASHRYHAMAYDSRRGELVLFGGMFGGNNASVTDRTWTIASGGVAESELSAAPRAPRARIAPALATFAPTGSVVMIGGQPLQGGPDDRTWHLDGGAWREAPSPSPLAAAGGALAYDAAGQRLVLLHPDGTWHAYDGAAWTELEVGDDRPAATPSPALTYDAERAELVAVTGPLAAEHVETWVLRGTQLTQRAVGQGPAARQRAALAFDVASRRAVLHGGADIDYAPMADTWIWDGVAWQDVTSVDGPGARRDAAMAADPVAGRLLLFGGWTGAGAADSTTWAWTDGAWSALEVASSPPPRASAAVAFDPVAGELVLFGGSRPDAFDLDRTWSLRLASPYPAALYPLEDCTADVDADGDGAVGCDDPDCWARCAPGCPPAAPACDVTADERGCGDGVCNLVLELGELCAADCDVCGDGVCAPAFESAASCAADCAVCGDAVCGADENAAACPGDCA